MAPTETVLTDRDRAGTTDATAFDGPGEMELVGRVTRTAPQGGTRWWAAFLRDNLRSNIHDEVVRFLVVALVVAQVADLWTTHVALAGSQLMERNPLFRVLFHSLPGLADSVKLAVVALLVLFAISSLPSPRSRHALLLAAAISIVAPISNFMLLAGRA